MTHPLQDRHAFKAARRALGLTVREVQEAMHLRDERTVRGWESGRNDIPGPAAVLMKLWADFPQLVPDGQAALITVDRHFIPDAVVTFKNGRR